MARVVRPHGTGVRGASLARRSVLFEGPFGRIFRALPPADFGDDDAASETALGLLATKMVADFDPRKDQPDAEESGIPAAYTYFGQFIDHDLTFDPASSLQRQNDPEALVDFRTPRFDLDNIYGRGPDDQPYLYNGATRKFVLGDALTGGTTASFDLPRSNADPQRAIIGDPRNDENVIISQLQGLFHRFHNAMVDRHPGSSFEEIQRIVRFHYQWVVVNDFLPTIVAGAVLHKVAPHISKKTNIVVDPLNLKFFKPRDEAFMPLEFAAAAYCFGHSMVRPGYTLNRDIRKLRIFHPTDPTAALTGFRKFPDNWGIDWARFIDLEPRPYGSLDNENDAGNADRLQLAYRIDTSLVEPLGELPSTVADGPTPLFHSLAFRNLMRGWRMRLPSGQSIARAMGVIPLTDDKIWIGKFGDNPSDKSEAITMDEIKAMEGGAGFDQTCPLWAYVLAETRHWQTERHVRTSGGIKSIKTYQLGEVGGRIVAETFLGILHADSSSYLSQDPLWEPERALRHDHRFGLRELIATALGVQVS